MRVDIVVPWLSGCAHRERALAWIRDRYAACHPDWGFVLAEVSAGPWVKAAAVMPAITGRAAGVVVVADADVWCEGLAAAVEAVHAGAPWAIPHRAVHRLSERGTAALIAGDGDRELTRRPYVGIEGGGFVVARRETLVDVPLDPRFVGWGYEDVAWGLALNRLAGRPWRGAAPLLHLWHPPQKRRGPRSGSVANEVLRQRYSAATSSYGAMRRLIEEGIEHGYERGRCQGPVRARERAAVRARA